MRTTVDLPDDLYRTLKTRAALNGVTLRVLVRELIEQALSQPVEAQSSSRIADAALPVAIPGIGAPITLSPDDVGQLEDAEDLERLARSS
jgi:plasmid stability protein